MLRRSLKLLACVVSVVSLSCGGDGGAGENGVSITGTWDGGAIPSPGIFLNLTFTLTDDDGTVSGTGTISVPGAACDVAVTGSRDGETFSLTMNCPGFQPWAYSGTAGAALLDGRFNGSGFTNLQFTMARD